MELTTAHTGPLGTRLRIALLADHPAALPALQQLFEHEWADYYGADGPGDAARDLQAFCNRDRLPLGVIALIDGAVAGVAALKAESIDDHAHLSPWAAAALVAPTLRRQGIGAHLIRALEAHARRLGYPALYTGTATAASLMRRLGWEFLENACQHGEEVAIFRKWLR